MKSLFKNSLDAPARDGVFFRMAGKQPEFRAILSPVSALA
jgi:hypothetical protein